jgi:acetate---CoA ligase (ADP-forming)
MSTESKVGVYPKEWTFDVVLKDGGVGRLRPIGPDDSAALDDLMTRMGRDSIYQRFLRVKEELSEEELDYFTHVDYDDRMAFVVFGDEKMLGVGRYDRVEGEPHVAEVAFAVADAHQGRGVGSQLLQHLTMYARTKGITAFRAFVLAENHAMIRVFRDAGYKMHRDLDEGVYTVEFPTEESPDTRAAEQQHEKLAVAASMMPVFYPHSIAVIGASRNPMSIGGRLFKNLVDGDFTGPVFPVNPKTDVVRSAKAYKSILDVPDPVDLAFIVVPGPFVIPAARECAEKGVRGLVVISAGFGETGDEGRAQEKKLLDVVRNGGMRMVGPNCMGVLNTDAAVSMDGQFGPRRPPQGNVAMSSQSGALGIAILDYATRLNIGISTFVSVGNKADVSGNDLLLYWEDDPATDVILLYLESFGNPRRFSRIAQRIGRRKPIVAVKSGRSAAGARAASSHTGSLASLDVAVDALFHQSGVIRTDTLQELFDVTALLANQPVPTGRKVAVLTNAGGPGILAVDALVAQDLEVPEFSDGLKSKLRGFLSDEASVSNPVDMIASAGAEQYAQCLDAMLSSDEVDSVIAIHIPAAPAGSEEIAEAIRDAGLTHKGTKTFLSVFMRASGSPKALTTGEARVPTFPFPEQAARALASAVRYGEWREKPTGDLPVFPDAKPEVAKDVVTAALERLGPDGGWLEPDEVAKVLCSYDLPLPRSATVHSADEAVEVAEEYGGPVVLKVISQSALHKSDIGGVVLNVQGADEVREAYEKVVSVVDDAEGALVQEFVGSGHEVLLGMTEDPTFGPLVVFGLGGVFVELIGDVAFRINPLTDLDVDEMIGEVKSARLLEGYRGADPGDVDALKDTLLRVSQLVDHLPEMVEMDLNPVKVRMPGEGVRIVDARIRVRPVQGFFVPSRRDVPAEA